VEQLSIWRFWSHVCSIHPKLQEDTGEQ
jgi:hypothetical protein